VAEAERPGLGAGFFLQAEAVGGAAHRFNAKGDVLLEWHAQFLGAVGFQYDPFGRRVGKTASGITTNYLYDGAFRLCR